MGEGRILDVERSPIGAHDTSVSLYRKLLPVTAVLAQRVFNEYFASGLPLGEEQQGECSYHFRQLPFDGIIQPDWNDCQVERFIRAMHFPPFKGAEALVEGKRVEVASVEAYKALLRDAAQKTDTNVCTNGSATKRQKTA